MIGRSGTITSHAERRALVGDHYINCCLRLLGGIRMGHVNKNGVDIVSYQKGRLIEVKGINHSHPLRFPVSQLEQLLRDLDDVTFPHGWLALFHYACPPRKQQRLLYKVGRTVRELFRYLGSNTLNCYILDLRIVEAIRNSQEPARVLQDNKMVAAVRIHHALLERLTGRDWRKELVALGLDPSAFRIRRYVTNPATNPGLRFDLAALVRKTPRSFRPLPSLFERERNGILQL